MPTRTNKYYRGMPAGRNYLVSILKFSNADGTEDSEWLTDEIWLGQGYDQGVPALNDLDEGIIDINFSGTTLPASVFDYTTAGKISPLSMYSTSATWLSNDESALNDPWQPWFLNGEESGPTVIRVFAQAVDPAITDGVVYAELEFRYYPTLEV